ncbi:MAG TPA: addiction module protein [Thermoanaerobaculia bacterium]|nr:addiction module protein [Thermoanaerobaculia bacterium]
MTTLSVFNDILPATSKLSLGERTELVDCLLKSVEDEADPEYERLWMEEIERRLREVDEGTVESIPAEEVFARLKETITSTAATPKREVRIEVVMTVEEIRSQSLKLPRDERLDLAYAILRDLADEGFEIDWERLKVVGRSEDSRTTQP